MHPKTSSAKWRPFCPARGWVKEYTIDTAAAADTTYATGLSSVNKLRPRQNGRHFPDDIFKCILLNENPKISIKIVSKSPINYIPALVQIMAWRRYRRLAIVWTYDG